MLSILIPIFNQDVTKLVTDLVESASTAGVDYEIRIYDDLSTEDYRATNQPLSKYPHVIYKELQENIGRANIRNLLAEDAENDRLLFLDGDSTLVTDQFISNYLSEDDPIIYGGRIYQDNHPELPYILHWKYGIEKEALPLKIRLLDPVLNFQSNNFMIDKKIMIDHPFDGSLDGYGYEDLVFARVLSQSDLNISHIDNPILHDGLETTQDFLHKQINALHNLNSFFDHNLIDETRLILFYKKTEKLRLLTPLLFLIKNSMSMIEKNLSSQDPSLTYLQLYKFYHFSLVRR